MGNLFCSQFKRTISQRREKISQLLETEVTGERFACFPRRQSEVGFRNLNRSQSR